MYLHLNKDQFPAQIVKLIQYNTQKIESLNLILYEDLNDALTASSLNEFMELIDLIPEHIPLSFSNINVLNQDSIKIILENTTLIKRLDKNSFLEIITYSDEAAEFALNNEEIKNKLNNIETKLYANVEIMPQTFEHSCSACAILMVLHENGIIQKEEINRVKELEIYKEIWVRPGFIADPVKLINYFRQYNLSIIGFEVDERSTDWLRLEKFSSKTNFINAKVGYSFFKQVTHDNYIEIKPGNKIDESIFDKGNISLLIGYANNPDNNTHMLLGRRMTNREFEVINPENGTKKTYDSFNTFYNLDKNFMGISFNISTNKM